MLSVMEPKLGFKFSVDAPKLHHMWTIQRGITLLVVYYVVHHKDYI